MGEFLTETPFGIFIMITGIAFWTFFTVDPDGTLDFLASIIAPIFGSNKNDVKKFLSGIVAIFVAVFVVVLLIGAVILLLNHFGIISE